MDYLSVRVVNYIAVLLAAVTVDFFSAQLGRIFLARQRKANNWTEQNQDGTAGWEVQTPHELLSLVRYNLEHSDEFGAREE